MGLHIIILLVSVFWGAVSQIILKKAALRIYSSKIKEYLNPYVIIGYLILFGTTFLSIYAYKLVPLSMGPIIQASSYIYVTAFGRVLFREKISIRKMIALGMIIIGIIVFSIFG